MKINPKLKMTSLAASFTLVIVVLYSPFQIFLNNKSYCVVLTFAPLACDLPPPGPGPGQCGERSHGQQETSRAAEPASWEQFSSLWTDFRGSW